MLNRLMRLSISNVESTIRLTIVEMTDPIVKIDRLIVANRFDYQMLSQLSDW